VRKRIKDAEDFLDAMTKYLEEKGKER